MSFVKINLPSGRMIDVTEPINNNTIEAVILTDKLGYRIEWRNEQLWVYDKLVPIAAGVSFPNNLDWWFYQRVLGQKGMR